MRGQQHEVGPSVGQGEATVEKTRQLVRERPAFAVGPVAVARWVQHDRVVFPAFRAKQSLFAVGRFVDGIALFAQCTCDYLKQLRFVFDDENSHQKKGTVSR